MTSDCYLNNRVFLSRNYRLIVAPRKFDVLKTNICPSVQLSTVFSADDYYPSGYFPRTGTMGCYSVSPRTNTIASRRKFSGEL